MANVLTILSIEILVHALVVGTSVPYLVKVHSGRHRNGRPASPTTR